MFKLFSLVILVLSSAESLKQLDGRIVGGEPVLISEYPFQVSLQAEGRHSCGGSIITKNHVVTAAHCVSSIDPNILTIRAGSSYHAKEGIVIEVEEYYEHPKYNIYVIDYDIAVVKLKENFVFNAKIQPTALFDLNEIVPEGIESIAIGWGILKENSMLLSAQLQAVKVPIVSLKECRKAYGFFVNERMICAGYPEGGKSACHGDSGGPLIVNNKLVGVTSWSKGCARPRYPGVYASVPNLRSFINDVTGLSSSSVSVRAGSTYKNRGRSLYLVGKVTIHPRYNPKDNDYNISILLLSRNLVFGPSMRPIVLPKPNENIGVGSMCVVSVWGLTQAPIPLQNINQLRAVRVPIVDRKSCRRSYGSSKITERMTCAGFKKEGKDSCTAESGSPLVFNGKLMSLVSWGYGRGIPNYPGVYTKVNSLRQFIRNATRL